MGTEPTNPPTPHTRRCLITGGAGFIGGHLASVLLERGDEVVVIDDLSTGRAENLPESTSLRFVEADLADHTESLAEIGPFDEIYHLAAAVGVQLVMDSPAEAIETNVGLTGALLRGALKAGPGGSPARVLLASSSEVYGKGTNDVFHEDDDALYGPTTVTRWSYAASKALDEHLAIAAHRSQGLPIVIARFFNTIGPRQVGKWGMVLPRFATAALNGDPLHVYGDGKQSRCFCDVRDVAEALPKLLALDEALGRVFNLGSDEPTTILELASMVIEEAGSESAVELTPYESVFPEGFEDLRRRRPSLARIKEAIGFEPKISLRQSVKDVVRELRSDASQATTHAESATSTNGGAS